MFAGMSLGAITMWVLGGLFEVHPDLALSVAMLFVVSGCAWALSRISRLADRIEQAGGRLCLYCRYDLRDLGDSGECPECGAAFSLPELSETWDRLVPPWRRAMARCFFDRRA